MKKMGYHAFMWLGIKIHMINYFLKKIKFTHVEGGSKIHKCHIKSKFYNYGTMVVDSLKRSSRRVEKENK